MKHKLLFTLGLIVLGWAVFAAVHAEAATGWNSYYPSQSWDQTISSASQRFIVLLNMNSEAVLDKETGLIWEQSPSTGQKNWEPANYHCNQLTKGNRKGWRLPTLQELASLVDPGQSSPALPLSNPFSNNVQTWTNVWSATGVADTPGSAWAIDFSDSGDEKAYIRTKTTNRQVWCVRGAQGVDLQ